MRIVSLRSENVKRLKAVHIEPDGNVVIIGGENGAGKTSVLDSIWFALGGGKALPPKPVREGADEATITLDLGDVIVTRTIAPDRKSTIKVVGKDGGRLAGPQAILDGLVGNLSFDPLEFSRMEPRQQAETLKRLVKLDFTALDKERADKFDLRRQVGREAEQLKGQLAAMRSHTGIPTAEVSVAKLAHDLQEAQRHNRETDYLGSQVLEAETTARQLIEQITALQAKLFDAQEAHRQLAAKWGQRPPRADEAAIVQQMQEAETVNRKVRENKDRRNIATSAATKQDAYEVLTKEIEGIDYRKAAALAAAQFPVNGLSFDDAGVSVNGMPFQQASAAEQLRISVAMGLAMNPKLKVLLVRDGSLLDAKSMALLAKMAEEAGGQVWLERVGEADASAIIIEDGQVRG